MGHNILPRIIRNYTPKGIRNQGRHLQRFLDMRERKESRSSPKLW